MTKWSYPVDDPIGARVYVEAEATKALDKEELARVRRVASGLPVLVRASAEPAVHEAVSEALGELGYVGDYKVYKNLGRYLVALGETTRRAELPEQTALSLNGLPRVSLFDLSRRELQQEVKVAADRSAVRKFLCCAPERIRDKAYGASLSQSLVTTESGNAHANNGRAAKPLQPRLSASDELAESSYGDLSNKVYESGPSPYSFSPRRSEEPNCGDAVPSGESGKSKLRTFFRRLESCVDGNSQSTAPIDPALGKLAPDNRELDPYAEALSYWKPWDSTPAARGGPRNF
jgi:hypothetical protein